MDKLYLKLYDQIRQDIIDKKYVHNQKLPSKRSLAATSGVSIKTVENAYYQLMLEGYIYSKEKSGFYVDDVNNYMTPSITAPAVKKEEAPAHNYILDLKSNKVNRELFPDSIWRKVMREVLSSYDDLLFETVPYNGLYKLRVSISNYLKASKSMDVQPDRIIIGAGVEYLYMKLFRLLGNDRHYAVAEPSSANIKALMKASGINYSALSLSNDLTDSLTRENCDIINISPSDNYPTGDILNISDRIKLLEWANEKKERYIIEDDFDSEYRHKGMPIKSMQSIDVGGKVIYINTFSKIIGPSFRIGYMILPPKLMKRYETSVNFYSCSVPSFEQLALAHFIDEGYLDKNINRIRRNNRMIREYFLKACRPLIESGDITISDSEVGSYFLMTFKRGTHEALSKHFEEHGILISSVLDSYEKSAPEYERTFVVNYSGIDEEGIDTFIDVVKGVVDSGLA